MLMTINSGMEAIARGRRSKGAEMCNYWCEVEECATRGGYITVCLDALPSRFLGGRVALRTSTPAFTAWFSQLLHRFHLMGRLMGRQFSFPKVSTGNVISFAPIIALQ
jgi:hypothetical protein